MRDPEYQPFLDDVSENFTLILIFLHSWDSKNFNGIPQTFGYRGFDYDVLRKLRDNDLIIDEGKRSLSVELTPEGIAMAKDFMESLTGLDI